MHRSTTRVLMKNSLEATLVLSLSLFTMILMPLTGLASSEDRIDARHPAMGGDEPFSPRNRFLTQTANSRPVAASILMTRELAALRSHWQTGSRYAQIWCPGSSA